MRAALKKKFKGLNLKDSAAPSTSSPSATAQSSTDHIATSQLRELSPTEQLWNEAYDAIKIKSPKLISAYEHLLTKELNVDTDGDSNAIAGNANRRQAQMRQVLHLGLEETESTAARKKTASHITQTLMLVKDAVAAGLKPSSEATLAWTAFTSALPLIHNSLEQSEKHREGVIRVTEILTKTDALAPYRLEIEDSIQPVLKTYLLALYQKLLSFLIQAACYCNRNQIKVIFQDAIKLDDWDTQIKEIRIAEKNVLDLDTEIKAQKTAQFQESILKDLRTEKDNACLAEIMITDPRLDKKRIEAAKGGLLRDSYSWILESDEFATWDRDGGLLWIRGDPGKGKTMLLCGIIDELQESRKLAYFFCQATNNAINTGIAVLRGLIYMLADEDSSLIPLIRKRLDKSSNIFDANSWFILSEILEEMIAQDTCFVIDALDECIANRQELIQFIRRNRNRARWVVSSRNWSDIEDDLGEVPLLSLEVNSSLVSNAVDYYIQYKVNQLAKSKDYDSNTKKFILSYLQQHANGTFLWVALVCRNLSNVRQRHIKSTLQRFPSDLNDLYGRMWEMVEDKDDVKLLKRILAVCAIVLRPVSLEELQIILEIPEEASATLIEVIQDCGSFLNVRECLLEFVHQSAKEYVDKQTRDTSEVLHHEIFCRSMDAMFRVLRRDMYDLADPAFPISNFVEPEIDVLANIHYSCVNWSHHLFQGTKLSKTDENIIRQFLGYHYLPWLEAMSLLKSIPVAVMALIEFERFASRLRELPEYCQGQDEVDLETLVWDARRFLQYFRSTLEIYPLQIYYAGTLFIPENCLVTKAFPAPPSMRILRHADTNWPPWLTSINPRPGTGLIVVTSVCFSHSSEWLAVAYRDGLIQIWHIVSIVLVQSIDAALIFEDDKIVHLSFTQAGDQLICGTMKGKVLKWKLSTDEIVQLDLTNVATISSDGCLVACASSSCLQIYNILKADAVLQTSIDTVLYHRYQSGIRSASDFLAFSPDAKCLAVCIDPHIIEIWYIQSVHLRCTISDITHTLLTITLSNEFLGILTHKSTFDRDDASITLYRLETGHPVWTKTLRAAAHTQYWPRSQIWISQNERYAVVLGVLDYTLFDTVTGIEYNIFQLKESLSISPDLCYVVFCSDEQITVYEWSGIISIADMNNTGEMSNRAMFNSISTNGRFVEVVHKVFDESMSIVDINSTQMIYQGQYYKNFVCSPSLMLMIIPEKYVQDYQEPGYQYSNDEEPMFNLEKLRSLGLRTIFMPESFFKLVKEYSSLWSVAVDNSYIAAATTGTEISIWHVKDQVKVLSVNCTESCTGLQWLPDNRRVTVTIESGIVLIDLDIGNEVLQIRGVDFMGFSEDGSSFITQTSKAGSDQLRPSTTGSVQSLKEIIRDEGFSADGPDGDIKKVDRTSPEHNYTAEQHRTPFSSKWPVNEDLQAGDLIQWNIAEKCGIVLGTFNLPEIYQNDQSNARVKKLCYNERFLVIYDSYTISDSYAWSWCPDRNLTISVWDRTSLDLLHQIEFPAGIIGDTLYLEGDKLRLNCGVITIGTETLRFGSEDEIFFDEQWIWKNGSRLIRVPYEYGEYVSFSSFEAAGSEELVLPKYIYRNKVLGLNRKHGGLTLLRFD